MSFLMNQAFLLLQISGISGTVSKLHSPFPDLEMIPASQVQENSLCSQWIKQQQKIVKEKRNHAKCGQEPTCPIWLKCSHVKSLLVSTGIKLNKPREWLCNKQMLLVPSLRSEHEQMSVWIVMSTKSTLCKRILGVLPDTWGGLGWGPEGSLVRSTWSSRRGEALSTKVRWQLVPLSWDFWKLVQTTSKKHHHHH